MGAVTQDIALAEIERRHRLKQMGERELCDVVLGTQVGGDHYTKQAIQPIEYIWANDIGFSEGNIIKYVSRWKSKGGIKDLEKAAHHANLLIEWARKQEAKGVKFGFGSSQ